MKTDRYSWLSFALGSLARAAGRLPVPKTFRSVAAASDLQFALAEVA
jgi:hypothetical protein